MSANGHLKTLIFKLFLGSVLPYCPKPSPLQCHVGSNSPTTSSSILPRRETMPLSCSPKGNKKGVVENRTVRCLDSFGSVFLTDTATFKEAKLESYHLTFTLQSPLNLNRQTFSLTTPFNEEDPKFEILTPNILPGTPFSWVKKL